PPPPGPPARDLGRQRLPRPARDRRPHPAPPREARGAPGGAQPHPHRSRRRLPLPGAVVSKRWAFGLRPRLLAALVFTAAVTLGVAALALLPPLQDKLTQQASDDLENATSTDRGLFERQITTTLRKTPATPRGAPLTLVGQEIYTRGFTLKARTDARVIVADAVPGEPPIFDTDLAAVPREAVLR